ncbi:hypothetical protein RHOER0001_1506 [Rhodococcus erythropolis SK121]|nr:hypothetical protein RHOER0001_1506 [Rhodococcus erythropolis SK121]
MILRLHYRGYASVAVLEYCDTRQSTNMAGFHRVSASAQVRRVLDN